MANHAPHIKPQSALREFLRSEAAGGVVLMVAAIMALVLANSGFADGYFHILHINTGVTLSPKLGVMTVHLWINDGLMALFFLLVGLEIKRELLDGHLSNWADRRLPLIAAAAGMVMPACIYLIIAHGDGALWHGWAIPAATDIAFAIGVLALLGSRVPASLKLFLMTVAIVDDLGAVVIIALFYTAQLDIGPLVIAAAIWAVMMGLNRRGVFQLWPYLMLAALLWYFTLLSGVHATIAGVMAAFAIPFERTVAAPDAEESPLHRLEHALSKPVAFVVVPLFGFANAGVTVAAMGPSDVFAPLPLGIALGLFLGKQLGVFMSVWAAVKLGFAVRPKDASWGHVYGVAILCGIGFTMSFFIGGLAFKDAALSDAMKVGVLMGSLLSAAMGFTVLRFMAKGPAVNKQSSAPDIIQTDF